MKPGASPERPLRWYEYVLALLPFLLVLSGVIGLAIGPAGCAVNLAAMRAASSRLVRAALAIVIGFIAFMLWALVVHFVV